RPIYALLKSLAQIQTPDPRIEVWCPFEGQPVGVQHTTWPNTRSDPLRLVKKSVFCNESRSPRPRNLHQEQVPITSYALCPRLRREGQLENQHLTLRNFICELNFLTAIAVIWLLIGAWSVRCLVTLDRKSTRLNSSH